MVLAVPAPEAMRLVELPDPPAAALRRVGYDGRCAVAMVLDHAIYSAVADAFGSQAELNVDGHKMASLGLAERESWASGTWRCLAVGGTLCV